MFDAFGEVEMERRMGTSKDDPYSYSLEYVQNNFKRFNLPL